MSCNSNPSVYSLTEHRRDVDKRQRNNDSQAAKRQRVEDGDEDAAHPFSKEEIDAEERKPKKKVAVLVGYAGSGYKGMQINAKEKTIEGDIFQAFVAAGAISKANADDPKKSGLVRCARTDKGVHAAGNVISLKLIVEDPDIVSKINQHLPDQIRVWGLERTNGSFSCYQSCDSRWYEYLIPTFSFLPPHPSSFLGKKLVESAEKEGVLDAYNAQLEDVASFWADAEAKYVKPILDELDPALAEEAMMIIHSEEAENEAPVKQALKQIKASRKAPRPGEETENKSNPADPAVIKTEDGAAVAEVIEEKKDTIMEDSTAIEVKPEVDVKTEVSESKDTTTETETKDTIMEEPTTSEVKQEEAKPEADLKTEDSESKEPATETESKSVLTPLEVAIKRIKAAYIVAKKAYRISTHRKDLVQTTLNNYLGTRNFHNYTIQKSFKDPSAKRVIRSFKVGPAPIIINNTEWLSLKVHGQSFMMHQIRKMVAMVAIVVRCGTPKERMEESYGPKNISIPKAPGLGLLLERPVFDTYNGRAVSEFQKEKIDFDKFQTEMEEFKQRQIYDRIFREEEKDHQ